MYKKNYLLLKLILVILIKFLYYLIFINLYNKKTKYEKSNNFTYVNPY